MERQTYQKKVVLELLKSTAAHPSAEQLYKQAKRKMPNISKGTVYRILNNFSQKGEIQELPSSTSRYDGDNSSHAHFICKQCGKIFDVFEGCRNCSTLKTKKIKVGNINYYQIYFYGKCKNCEK